MPLDTWRALIIKAVPTLLEAATPSEDLLEKFLTLQVLTFVVVGGPTSCIQCTIQIGYVPPLDSPLWRSA